jgi:hypothetical protein
MFSIKKLSSKLPMNIRLFGTSKYTNDWYNDSVLKINFLTLKKERTREERKRVREEYRDNASRLGVKWGANMDTDYFLKIGRLIDEEEKIEEERTQARKEHKEVGKIRRAKWDTDMAEIEATRLEYIKGIKEQGK